MSSQDTMSSVLDQVVAQHLCCGCGACVAACPEQALCMKRTPAGLVWAGAGAEGDCTGCGLCLQVCPSRGISSERLSGVEDPFVGKVLGSYSGWATDSSTCSNGTSGGVVTAILSKLLDSGEIEAALLSRWSEDDPLRAEAYVAHSSADLVRSQKSKYCMVPLMSGLKADGLLAELEGKKVAIVGLPCHVQALSNLQSELGVLRDALVIGLFCDRVLSYHVVDELIAETGLGAAEVSAFEYRDKGQRGWPGDVLVKDAAAEGHYLDRSKRTGLKEYYTPIRCRLCFDKLNVLADIACGDGYGAPSRSEGISTLLVRTEAGQKALDLSADRLELQPIELQAVAKAQSTEGRKRNLAAHVAAYEDAYPGVLVALPQACRDGLAATSGASQVLLKQWLAFENAATAEEARTLAREAMARDAAKRNSGGFAGRVLKALKRRLAGH